ncbi:MAG: translation initiation factor IF-3 C-terminal domain-containing protein, partial [Actinomycetota bacterium]|nr:translation initiation factor IF-3 C-terminal domain-containing protein [Actinomycetota bacterium]
ELGERLLRRLADDLEDLGRVESQPNLDGRNMVMVLAPKKDTRDSREAKDSKETQAPERGGRKERAARS